LATPHRSAALVARYNSSITPGRAQFLVRQVRQVRQVVSSSGLLQFVWQEQTAPAIPMGLTILHHHLRVFRTRFGEAVLKTHMVLNTWGSPKATGGRAPIFQTIGD